MDKEIKIRLEKFNFEKCVRNLYGKDIIRDKLKNIYNVKENKKTGTATKETCKKGIYAIYYEGELKKIGKASDKRGIFHRMSQYYNAKKNNGIKEINKSNRDLIDVEVCYLDDTKSCWEAERLLQGIASFCNEEMPWEKKR